jgi:hypothetical protein
LLGILEPYGDDYIIVKLGSDVMQGFPLAIVVDTGPGEDGPQVIELPVEASHAHRGVPSDGLYADAHPISLHAHGQVGKVLHIVGLGGLEKLLGVFFDNIGSTSHLVAVEHPK